MTRKFAPPPTKFGNAPSAQRKAASGAPAVLPPPTKFGSAGLQAKTAQSPRTGGKAVVQRMEDEVQDAPMVSTIGYGDLVGVGDQGFRGQFAFSDYDFGTGAGYYTAAVAKVNGYVFGKYYSGNAGHAEHQALQELYKVTFAARHNAQMFLEKPSKNKLTIYVSKSPCSSHFYTSENTTGCAEKIIGNKEINGYEFEVKVRYGTVYTPKGMGDYNYGPKKRSELAIKDMTKKGVDTDAYDTSSKKTKGTTGSRGDPHPFRFIS